MTRIRTHTVAAAAYTAVAARQGVDFKKAYGALTHKLPGMVLQNGLAQATGFLLAKGGASTAEHNAVLDDLLAVLRAGGTTQAQDRAALHREIIQADLARTMEMTRRSLDASAWMKRYVQGVLGIGATGEEDQGDTEEGAGGDQP
jgi:CRISPR-associated protein Cmr5